MYNSNQNGTSYHDYPYDPRTHTFASPGGFHYPAPNTQHHLQLDHVTNGHFYQQEGVPYMDHGRVLDPGFVRYGPGDWVPDPRAGLGISTAGHSNLNPRHIPYQPPHTSYHLPDNRLELAPVPYRSITLDSASARHHNPTPPFSRSSIHFQSANQTRTNSPLSSRSSQRRPPHADWNDTPRTRPRVGGPPKAPLGGIGGKPWDERTKDDRSVSSPLPAQDYAAPCKPGKAMLEGEEPTFKGSPIVFKPPPTTYSPEDSPEPPQSELHTEGGENSVEDNSIRVSRKEAFPWPTQSPRGPPVTIPLPPSPVEPDPEKGGRRTWTSIASTAIMEPADGALIKGKRKQVVLAIPNEAEWKAQSSLIGLSSDRKQQLWEAVYLRPEPPAPGIPASQENPAIMHDEEEKVTDMQTTSTPPPYAATSGILETHRSPPTPTRRGQSSTASASSAFVRRQLGGMLRSGPSGRSARTRSSTNSIPESSEGTEDGGAGGQSGLEVSNSTSQKDKNDIVRDDEGVPSEEDSVHMERTRVESIGKVPIHPLSGQSWTAHPEGSPDQRTNKEPEADVRPAKRLQNHGDGQEEKEDGQDQERIQPSTMRKHSDAESTTPSSKKLRPTAEVWEPRSRTLSSDIRPIPRLRPTAHAFTPSISRTPSASYVPTEAGQFTFQSSPVTGAHSTSDLGGQTIDAGPLGPGTVSVANDSRSIVGQSLEIGHQNGDVPEESQDHRSQEDERNKSHHNLGESSLSELPAGTAKSQASLPSRNEDLGSNSDTDDGMDLPTARPFSQDGVAEEFSVHQDRPSTAIHNSPAAEIHGIFAESPNASISDSGLFYRRPRSEASDPVEVLSDSFDPVSYSYESDTESTYEVPTTAVFFTSTPRGGHHVLPIGSVSSMSGHPDDGQEEDVPAVTYPDPDPRRRFIEWTFPATDGHRPMPSIYRRHTFDHLTTDHQGEDLSSSPEPGIASTFASRVGDLRAHLALVQNQSGKSEHLRVSSGPSGMLSTKSSAESPMRSPSRVLAVINDTPGDRTGLGDVALLEDEDHDVDPTMIKGELVNDAEIRHLLSGISARLDSTIEAMETSSKGYRVDFSPLTTMLEQQSTLISSLANVIQQNRGHQHDHFVPILEGQQAVLDKLSSLQGTQSEVTDVVARFDQLQSDVVEDLRSELVKVTTERDEHKAENHRLDLELLEARQALASAERETMESRRSFEAALSRKTTLQSDLHAAQAEKQSLSVELQSISSAQQRQAQISKKHQTDLETKQQELSDEKRRNESLAETIRLQSSELAEVRQSTSKFQETLIDRLSRIEEGVQQSTVGLGDRVVLQKENQRSQGEVDDLKMMRHDAKQQSHIGQTVSTTNFPEVEDLRKALELERELRQKATDQAKAADEALKQEITTQLHAQQMAQERVKYAQVQEAQLQARTRECQKWQHLALTQDRNAYRNYTRSKPTNGVDSKSVTGAGTSTPKIWIKSTEASPEHEDLQTPGRVGRQG